MKKYEPFIKWVGGKGRLLEQYKPHLPERAATYYEPFIGGAAVFFHLRSRDFAERYVIADVNPELVNVYRVVRDALDALCEHLAVHAERHSEDHYYAVRKWDREPGWPQRTAVERAARMIYMNRTCFNGLWRVNSKGQYNVPIGRYKNPTILDRDKLTRASEALQGVLIRHTPFQYAVASAGPGDFVYFDPPYVPLSATSNFTSYAANGFGLADQRELARTFRRLAQRGACVMLSNSAAPLVYGLYPHFSIHEIQARRAINSDASKRGAITELLITT